MTCDEALEDHEGISLTTAGLELRAHGCCIMEHQLGEVENGPRRILVTNDIDAPEWIDCTPAAILAWLGY